MLRCRSSKQSGTCAGHRRGRALVRRARPRRRRPARAPFPRSPPHVRIAARRRRRRPRLGEDRQGHSRITTTERYLHARSAASWLSASRVRSHRRRRCPPRCRRSRT